MNSTNLKPEYQVPLLGLAIGDALGTPVEFMPPGTFEPVTGFQSSGRFNLNRRVMACPLRSPVVSMKKLKMLLFLFPKRRR